MMGRVQSSTAKVKYFSTFLRSSTAPCCIQQSDTHFFSSFFLFILFFPPAFLVCRWLIHFTRQSHSAREKDLIKQFLSLFVRFVWTKCNEEFSTVRYGLRRQRRQTTTMKGKICSFERNSFNSRSRYCCTAHMFNVTFFFHFIRFSSTFLNDIQLNGGIVCY